MRLGGFCRRATVSSVAALCVAAGGFASGSAMARPLGAAEPVAGAVPAAVKVADTYAAITANGSTHYLRLVSKSTGKVLATLGSGRTESPGFPQSYFSSVDLARDGSVYAVAPDRTLHPSYQWSLYRYTTKGVTKLQPFIASAQESPDGKRLATTVISPDGDGDGFGLLALRIADKKGKGTQTLMSAKLAVWKDGSPAIGPGAPEVVGWLPNGDLAMSNGCCDGGWAWVASSTRPTPTSQGWLVPRRGSLRGNWGTTIIGYKGAQALGVQWDNESGTSRARWMTKTGPTGKFVRTVKAAPLNAAETLNKGAGATPLQVSPRRFPYRGPGKVVGAYL